jgi:hypothetical protein
MSGAEGLRIEIPAKRESGFHAFLGAWLGLWTLAGVGMLAGGWGFDEAFPIFWLCCWVLVWLLIAASLYWSLLGREIVTATPGELIVERAAGPFRSEKRFDASRVNRLRMDAYPGLPRSLFGGLWSWRATLELYGFGGSVVFDYEGRTRRFGSKLDEAESRQLVELIAAELGVKPPAQAPERPGSY